MNEGVPFFVVLINASWKSCTFVFDETVIVRKQEERKQEEDPLTAGCMCGRLDRGGGGSSILGWTP